MPRSNSAPTLADVGVSAGRARQHETLVVRLEALLKDVWRLAARSPEGAVSDPLRAAAEALLFEAQRFHLRGRRDPLPVAPPTLGALGVELGQARARLEAFELSRSFWSPRHKAFVWRIAGGPVPIGRLRPVLPVDTVLDAKATKQMRDKIMRRIEEREEIAYARGYDDARTGRPKAPETP